MQAGTVIAQIADDTTDRRAVGQGERGTLKYCRPRNAPTLEHGQPSNLQFGENEFRRYLLHIRKLVSSFCPNLCKPYSFMNSRLSNASRALSIAEKHSEAIFTVP